MKAHVTLAGLFAVAIGCTILFAGCRAHRQLSSQQTIEERDNFNEHMVTRYSNEELSKLTESTITDKETWSFTMVFDTSKPADPETGLPPVESIQATGTKQQVQEDREEENESSSVENTETETSGDTKVDIVTNEDRSASVGHFPEGLFDYLSIALFVIVFIWGFNNARKDSSK